MRHFAVSSLYLYIQKWILQMTVLGSFNNPNFKIKEYDQQNNIVPKAVWFIRLAR